MDDAIAVGILHAVEATDKQSKRDQASRDGDQRFSVDYTGDFARFYCQMSFVDSISLGGQFIGGCNFL